ncbi:MAG: hypothetical protein IJ635_12260 [Bacteroidaceae bacterium]|nr:hypothetical protein [Bacteroidaceae bacterium]
MGSCYECKVTKKKRELQVFQGKKQGVGNKKMERKNVVKVVKVKMVKMNFGMGHLLTININLNLYYSAVLTRMKNDFDQNDHDHLDHT